MQEILKNNLQRKLGNEIPDELRIADYREDQPGLFLFSLFQRAGWSAF